jgi:hypothetical protein
LNYLATVYADDKLISYLVAKLLPLNLFPAEYWESLKNPIFESWSWEEDEGGAATEFRGKVQKAGTWETYLDTRGDIGNFLPSFREFIGSWKEAKSGSRDTSWLKHLVVSVGLMKWYSSKQLLEFWDDFEGYLSSKIGRTGTTIPEIRCVHHIFEVMEQYKTEVKRNEEWRKACNQASQFFIISIGIVYIASRLTILVLLFTCLRAVPEGVYEDTPWTRFLPNFS